VSCSIGKSKRILASCATKAPTSVPLPALSDESNIPVVAFARPAVRGYGLVNKIIIKGFRGVGVRVGVLFRLEDLFPYFILDEVLGSGEHSFR